MVNYISDLASTMQNAYAVMYMYSLCMHGINTYSSGFVRGQ